MVGKKKSKQPKIYIGGFKQNFDEALFAIQNGLFMEKDFSGKIDCLNFVVKALQTDLKHSILSESIYKKDITDLKDSYIPSITPLKTDGQNWINQQTGEIIKPVLDFRIAVMFEVEKMKFELQHELKSGSRDVNKN